MRIFHRHFFQEHFELPRQIRDNDFGNSWSTKIWSRITNNSDQVANWCKIIGSRGMLELAIMLFINYITIVASISLSQFVKKTEWSQHIFYKLLHYLIVSSTIEIILLSTLTFHEITTFADKFHLLAWIPEQAMIQVVAGVPSAVYFLIQHRIQHVYHERILNFLSQIAMFSFNYPLLHIFVPEWMLAIGK